MASGARVVVTVLTALVVGACTSTPTAPGTSAAPAGTASASRTGQGSGASPVLTGEVAPEAWLAQRAAAAEELVRRRAAAAGSGDEGAWLSPLAGAPRSKLAVRQAAVLRRMVAMRVIDVAVTNVRERTAPVPSLAGRPVDWDVRASLTYRLRGFDTAPRSFELDLTLRADPSRPAAVTIVASEPVERPQPWDLDHLVVRRTADVLVFAVGTRSKVAEVLSRARKARARVAAVWGRVPPAVWVAPATDGDAARLLGRATSGVSGVAAATDGPLTPGEPAGADRVVIVPGAWRSLRPAGRDVVMTHELTHVAVRASTTREVPLWLSEGFAELVAWRSVDLPERTVTGEALDAVRTDGIPRTLPPDREFDPDTARLPVSYGLSLLALRTLADRYGTAAVVRLYRAAAGGLDVPTSLLGDAEAVTDRALTEALRTDRGTLVRAWQSRIRSLLR